MLPQLGDFDSLEYAQALVAAWPQLEAAGINVLAIGIGEAGTPIRCIFGPVLREFWPWSFLAHVARIKGLLRGLQPIDQGLTGGVDLLMGPGGAERSG
jgi:hypothetical protein